MNLDERLLKEPLSLTIARGDVPFDLLGKETRLRPEDWAWQFLRLNDDYRTAYRTAQEKQQHATDSETRQPGRIVMQHACRSILADEDICRASFGLSTWLDPNQIRLPELDRGESWFSPLSPIDITSTHVSLVPSHIPPHLSALRIDPAHTEMAFYVVTSGVFGRPEKHNVENITGDPLRYQRPHLFFLVDSSIPPTGQLLEIEKFVGYIRKRMVNSVCTAPPPFRGRRTQATVEALNERHALAFPSLRRMVPPLAPGAKPCNAGSTWSVVKLDFRVPLKENIGVIREQLTKKHEKLVADGVAINSPWERFRHELSAPRKTDDVVLTDGHSLKAYAVIAELRQIAGRDLIPAEIEHVIKERSYPANNEQRDELPESLDEWLAKRIDRITGYIDRAQRFVGGDYRWLIYTQKPDTPKQTQKCAARKPAKGCISPSSAPSKSPL
ncbi:DUF6499 domain-containing protein [Burkholderia sp. AU30280]|uniref:transcriptional regulator domain-containing protein n=1 Tax=Burkholderia sp. AU30280 TaxID=2879628 RepID=UPI001CF5D8B4|nr:DUF6499 domain-containing protein [Burkholderia sp. AU30280]MCA8275050.1 DUF6499 domain-containing protein [Burkholderia sp. AU30280]